jgi:hypothetical protein
MYGGWRALGAWSQTRTISTDHPVWAITRRPLNRIYRHILIAAGSTDSRFGAEGAERLAERPVQLSAM